MRPLFVNNSIVENYEGIPGDSLFNSQGGQLVAFSFVLIKLPFPQHQLTP